MKSSNTSIMAAAPMRANRAGGSPPSARDDDLAGRDATSPSADIEHTVWPLIERPGFLVRRLHQIHVSLFAEICAVFGVTPLQYSLLSCLNDLGEADQTRLASAVAIDRTTATGVLKRLQARGLVTRKTSVEDRRSLACALTSEGRALHAAMEASARQAHEATVAPLDPAEQAVLTRLMKRIVEDHGARTSGAALE